jgi:hypothetical protein
MDPTHDPSDDEIAAVLASLKKLMNRVRRPIIRACLEEAYDDIAHLSESAGESADDLWSIDAA